MENKDPIHLLESCLKHLHKSWVFFSEDDSFNWECLNPNEVASELGYAIEEISYYLNCRQRIEKEIK